MRSLCSILGKANIKSSSQKCPNWLWGNEITHQVVKPRDVTVNPIE
jgi:hypothetical protein